MRLLLDTHIALWAIVNSPRLPNAARRWLEDDNNALAVSVISLWEIGIKHRLGRSGPGAMPISAEQARDQFELSGYDLLPLTAPHVLAFEQMSPVHTDPFDRMLVAQARSEPMRLLTHDRKLADYGEAVILV
jgi:PIN domain nuclease of toxin-antitoxin system